MEPDEIEVLKETVNVIAWNADRMSTGYSELSFAEIVSQLGKIIRKYEKKKK